MVNLSGRNEIIADSIKILDNGSLIDVMDMLNASPATGVSSSQLIELHDKIKELTTSMQNKVDGIDIEDLIDERLADIIDNAPDALNTLKELADAMANDADFAATIQLQLLGKAPLKDPSFSGTIKADDINVSGNLTLTGKDSALTAETSQAPPNDKINLHV